MTDRALGPGAGADPGDLARPRAATAFDAERNVLGELLARFEEDPNTDALDRVRERLGPLDFRWPPHRQIFDAICAVADRGQRASAFAVRDELAGTVGDELLAEIVEYHAAGDLLRHYADLVRQHADREQAEGVLQKALERVRRGADLNQVQVELGSRLAELLGPDSEAEGLDLFKPYGFDRARLDLLAIGDGCSTGFAGLDRVGFTPLPGNVYAIAGRQGGGKTALLLEIVMRHVEATPEACALFVTFEGHRAELLVRLLLRQVARHRVEQGRDPGAPPRPEAVAWIRAGAIPYSEGRPHGAAAGWEQEMTAARNVLDAHLHAGRLVLVDGDDVPSENGRGVVTVSRLVAALALAPRRPTLAAFDYFQKVAPDDRTEARYLQLAAVSDRLRRYAKGDGDPARAVPVLTAGQVNREAADRQPGLENVREADDLANDAAGVVTIRLPETDDRVKRMTLRVVKHRHGPSGGRFDLDFHGACGYFAEPDPDAENAARASATRARIMTDVQRFMEQHPNATTRETRDAVKGKNELIDECRKAVLAKNEGHTKGARF